MVKKSEKSIENAEISTLQTLVEKMNVAKEHPHKQEATMKVSPVRSLVLFILRAIALRSNGALTMQQVISPMALVIKIESALMGRFLQ
jgi:hypothetical protein